MNRRIIHAGTLVYYDGIQVFEGRDLIGGHYIAVCVNETKDSRSEYLIAGVAPQRLQFFRLGLTDLADLIRLRPEPSWLFGTLETEGESSSVEAEVIAGDIPDEYMPDAGFLLPMPPELAKNSVYTESTARNSLAMEISFESRVPSQEHRMGADVLGGVLIQLQSLLKNSYRKTMSLMGGHADRDGALLDVAVPALPGSFKVLLVPSQLPDLFRHSQVSRALNAIDYLLEFPADPQGTLLRVQQYAGHAASAFVRLLRFIVANDLAFRYTWAEPGDKSVSSRVITRSEAIPLLSLFGQSESIVSESLTIGGRLRKIDVASGSWRLQSPDDGREHSGSVRPGITLSGLVADQSYTFVCEEEIEEITGTGREIRRLFLSSPPTNPAG